MAFFRVQMDVDAPIVCQHLAQQHQPAAQELDELTAQHLVLVRLLFILHEVLTGGEGRVNVDQLDLAARAEAIQPALVGQQLAQRQQVVAPHEQVAPAVIEGPVGAEAAHKLPRRGRRLSEHLLAAGLALVHELVLFADLDRARAIGEEAAAPAFRQGLAGRDQADQLVTVCVGQWGQGGHGLFSLKHAAICSRDAVPVVPICEASTRVAPTHSGISNWGSPLGSVLVRSRQRANPSSTVQIFAPAPLGQETGRPLSHRSTHRGSERRRQTRSTPQPATGAGQKWSLRIPFNRARPARYRSAIGQPRGHFRLCEPIRATQG